MSLVAEPVGVRLKRPAVRLLAAFSLALGAAYVVMLAYHAAAVVVFPYDLNYGEGYVMNDAWRLVRGKAVWNDIREFPMVRSPYPPLFLLVDGLLMLTMGPTLVAGRLLSALSAAATAGLIFVGARSITRNGVAAALCALLFLGSPALYQWVAFSRVDQLAMALSLGSIVLLLPGADRGRVAAAAGLCALALLTKQTSVAAPAAIFLWLALSRRRTAVAFALGVGMPVAVATGALTLATGGQYLQHVWLGNIGNPFSVARMVVMEVQFLTLHSVLAVAALTMSVRYRTGLAGVYAWTAFATTLSVGNEGSSINYFLEFLASACLAVAAGYHGFLRRFEKSAHLGPVEGPGSARQGLALALAGLQLGMLVHFPNLFGVWPSYFPPHGFTPTARDEAVGQRLDGLIQGKPEPMLLEPAALAVRNGRQVMVQPIDLRAEHYQGRWSSDRLIEAVAREEFSLVVLSFQFLPNDVLAELRRSYSLSETLTGDNGLTYHVYEPTRHESY